MLSTALLVRDKREVFSLSFFPLLAAVFMNSAGITIRREICKHHNASSFFNITTLVGISTSFYLKLSHFCIGLDICRLPIVFISHKHEHALQNIHGYPFCTDVSVSRPPHAKNQDTLAQVIDTDMPGLQPKSDACQMQVMMNVFLFWSVVSHFHFPVIKSLMGLLSVTRSHISKVEMASVQLYKSN